MNSIKTATSGATMLKRSCSTDRIAAAVSSTVSLVLPSRRYSVKRLLPSASLPSTTGLAAIREVRKIEAAKVET